MQWIKASERLPENNASKLLFIKYKVNHFGNMVDARGTARRLNDNWILNHEGQFEIIEWLDESIPSGGKSAEEIKQIAEQRLANAEWLDNKQKADTTFGFRIGYKAAMEEYARQFAHQQPVSMDDIEKAVDKLAKESTAPDKETQDWMKADIRRGIICGLSMATQQPVQGYSMEDMLQAHMAGQKSAGCLHPSTIEAIAYISIEQPVNDGWVRVEDELPRKDGNSQIYCLCFDKYRKEITVLPYNEYHDCWDKEDGDDHYTNAVGGNVTHWQPLPPPPKQ